MAYHVMGYAIDMGSFIICLDVGDGKVAISPSTGDRESVKDPISLLVTSVTVNIYHMPGDFSWLLLIP
jgi:hypothetical protein